LIADALRRCLELSERLGVHAVQVDAIDPRAEAFHRKPGFVSLRDNPLHLHVPIASIRKAFGAK